MRITFMIFALFIAANLHAQPAKNKLFVFVGEKISVNSFEQELPKGAIPFNNAFKAKYKILQTVYGNYNNDTIEFEVYDHYGDPAFSKYPFALLYVSELDDGRLVHEKYMYSDVYKTVDGRWAGSYQSLDYNHQYNENTTVKPEPILFKEPVWYEVSKLDKETRERFYPEPYFRIERGRAYAVLGNYIEELFKLKRDGFLKARKLF